METGFWRYLHGEDDSRLLLRQRAPEVVVFRGCRLEAWYHSNGNGVFTRRLRNVTIASALDCFLAAASAAAAAAAAASFRGSGGSGAHGLSELSAQTPAAILRRRSAVALDGGRDLPDVPQVSVLSVQELTEAFQRAQNGIEDEEADVWSVQTIVRPAEDLRILSVYNCEASGVERSDIFGRSYSKLYPLTPNKEITVRCPDAVHEDLPVQVSTAQRAAVEAKTLGLVRFASRFHGLELEGVVLEFVVDASGHAVLHCCWCAAVFGPETKRKFRSGGAPCRSGTMSVPRVFPVPFVPSCPSASGAASQAGDSAEGGAASADVSAAGPAPPGAAGGGGAEDGDERCVLLEVWRGEEFLGEALVPCGGGEQRVRLLAASDAAQHCTRPDKRKRQPSRASIPGSTGGDAGSVLVDARWSHGGNGRQPLLRFVLRRAEGLLPSQAKPGHAPGQQPTPRPRALLWLRTTSSGTFSPLWASRECGDEFTTGAGTMATWDETVELRVEDAPSAQSTPTAPAMFTEGVSNGTAPSQAKGSAEVAQGVQLKSVLQSARELVCGAQWNAHWGACEEDGAMRGSTLAAQVSQRLGTEKINRSLLLTQLANHVDQFSEVQQAWEEQLEDTKAKITSGNAELQDRRAEAESIQKETATLVQEHEKRLAGTCKQMCGALDEHRIQEQLDDIALEQSKQRISEQRTMVHQLVDKSHALQGSLDRTVRKFDEVSSSYAQVQGDLMRSQIVRPRAAQDLSDSIGQAQEISAEVADDQQKMTALKCKLNRLQDDLNAERDLSIRFEEFVRKVAAAPPARLRTGGGWQLDSTAKSEAVALLQKIGR